jgi:hypothetical protein
MFHIIYKTEHPNGKYYIGRHSTNDPNDLYYGSGKWVRSIKDKSVLVKTILEFADSLEHLKELEEKYINMNIEEENCMNFNNNSCGFASGELNPSNREERKKIMSEKFKGKNNPMAKKGNHTEESKEKIREKMMGENNPFYGKNHTEETKEKLRRIKTGHKQSEETRQKDRDNHKNGKYAHLDMGKNFRGKKHNEDTIIKMKESHSKISKQKCIYCGLEAKPNAISRWHNDNCRSKGVDHA